MAKKFVNVIFILVFIMMLIIPILTINTEKNRKLTSENRIAAQFPTVFDKDGKFMGGGTLTKGVEKWLNDNIGFRDMAGIIKTKVDWYAFDELNHKNYFKGENGWISEGQEYVIKNYINYGFEYDDINKYISFYEDLYNISKDNDLPMVGMIIPDKKDIYPEYYSNNINKVKDVSRVDRLVKYINNTDIPFIDMKPILMKYKSKDNLYSPTVDPDHWNQSGAFIGYIELMNKIQKYLPNINIYNEDDFNIELSKWSRTYNGGLTLIEDYYKFTPNFNNDVVKLDNKWKDKIDPRINKNTVERYINKNNSNAPKLLVFADSYFLYTMIPYFLKYSFSEITVVSNTNIMNFHNKNSKHDIQYYIDISNPDIVVGESVYRMLGF